MSVLLLCFLCESCIFQLHNTYTDDDDDDDGDEDIHISVLRKVVTSEVVSAQVM